MSAVLAPTVVERRDALRRGEWTASALIKRAGVRGRLAMVAIASLAAACGSTVQTAGSGVLDPNAGIGLSAPAGAGMPVGPAGSAAGSAVAVGSRAPELSDVGGGSAAVGGGSGSISGPTTAGNRFASASGVGIDTKHVYIGVPTENDFNTAVGAFGISHFDVGDQEGDVNAVVAYINKQGGVLGRQLVPVFRDTSTAVLVADRPSAVQANCSYYADDRQVAAVIDMTAVSGLDSWGCWRKHRIPFFVATPYVDQITFDQMYPYMYGVNANRTDSYFPTLVARQQALGYFKPWDTLNGQPGSEPVKVGILYEENGPQDLRVVAQLKRELQARHIPVVAEFGVQGGDLSQVGAQVLKFKSAGVTHAYIYYELENLLFMRQAENQQYRPRYAAWMAMGSRLMQAEAPARQLRGALGATWNPDLSVDARNNPGDVSADGPLCRKILHDAGLNYERYSVAEMVGLTFCDALRLTAQAINGAGGTQPQQLRQAVSAAVAAKRFASAIAFRTTFSVTRSDENGAVRDLGYVESCSCFRYLSKTNHSA